MKSPEWTRRLFASILGAAMLGVIVVAALSPNVGVGAAKVNSQYTSTNSAPTTLEYALIGILVIAIIAAIVGLLVFQRRRNRGGGGAGGVAAWQEPGGGQPPQSGPGMDNTGGMGGATPAGAVTYGAVGAAGGAAAGASYDEASTPETGPDWAEPAAAATMGGAAGGAAAAGESEPDIDRLMKELDQISDDILKKTPPKKGVGPETTPETET